ncbi:lipopolysaccharide biosynthesis protein [Naasia sp. SYSU D00948]|uniref:lipopolysaccharide biosynthesis protein n=1 Tax=Naasia sp. SYSU D00948 TaxID=2817379 RepID=UPI001B308A7F|nr:oligosaccharide flippase family protein [Naasia sp. SYSU D00948]
MRRVLRRLAGFAGLPLLSALAPFVLLPLVARTGGVDGWTAVSIGQSVGMTAGVVVSYGWTLSGPSRLARAAFEDRPALYADSVLSRLLLLIVVSPIAAWVSGALTAREDGLAMAVAVAFTLGGLSPAWYSIGLGRPSYIARYEVLPRTIAVAALLVLIPLTGELLLYPLLLALATVGGVIAYSHRIGRLSRRLLRRNAFAALRSDWVSASTVVAASAYSSTSVALLGVTSPASAVAGYSSGEKIYRLGLLAVQALSNSLQAWVAEQRPQGLTRRMLYALAAHVALGASGLAGLALVGPPVAALLFGPDLAPEPATMVYLGLAYLAVAANTATGRLILVPLGLTRHVLLSTLAGAATGVVAILSLSAMFGESGAAAGLAVGEAAVVLVQAGAILLRVRTRRTGEQEEEASREAAAGHP